MAPRNEDDIAEALTSGGPVIPVGGGTKRSWGLPASGRELSVRGLDTIVAIEPGDFICVAQAGVRLCDLQAALAGSGQRLMLDPAGGDEATLGGIVASNASGSLRHRYGAPRDLLIGARFVLADGTIARSGGRVVKNVAGYDIGRLLCGSLGTLAVITEVAFRLHPTPEAAAAAVFASDDPNTLAAFVRAVRAAPVVCESLELRWPAGAVIARFGSTAAAARTMADSVVALAQGARLLEPDEADEGDLRSSPGALVGVGVPLTAIGELVSLVARLEGALALRAGIGVGEARVPVETVVAFAQGVEALGGHVMPRRDAAIEPIRDTAALALMRAVKARLDPQGVLSPGRLWSAA